MTKTLLSYIFGSLLLLVSATCNNTSEGKDRSSTAVIKENSMEITGTIREQGITSYQYGTHTIETENNFYALKSEAVDLSKYLDQEVTIVAEKIEGYPVDGGPDYLLVLEVK